jgi:hypothetical protein
MTGPRSRKMMIAWSMTDANALPALFWRGVGIPIGGRYFGRGPGGCRGARVIPVR